MEPGVRPGGSGFPPSEFDREAGFQPLRTRRQFFHHAFVMTGGWRTVPGRPMSTLLIAEPARPTKNRPALHLGAAEGGTGAGESSLCYEGDIHVPDLQIHPPLRTRLHRTLG